MADAELAELRKQCITSLYLCADNVSKYVDDEKDESFGKLKKYVQEYCVLEAQEKLAIDALEMAKQETRNNNIDTLPQRFSKNLNSLTGKKLDANKHPFMIQLNKKIEEGKRNMNADPLDESDLAITETQSVYKDPISMLPIKDPVKNSVCGHIYEKKNILEEIRKRGHKAKCPVAGCANKALTSNQLVEDEELNFRMTLTQHSTMIQERSVMDLDMSM